MSGAERVIARLKELEFRVERDRLELFGEELPLLKAIAVDDRTHQLVLVAEQEGPPTDEPKHEELWRQLLFAVSGLRHHLRGSNLPALSPPILLAVAEGVGVETLQEMAEEIAENYALFSRVEINIVEPEKIEAEGDDVLDLALAPLLPCVRRAIDEETTVTAQDVEQFWIELEGEIRDVAREMEKDFGESANSESADRIIEELREMSTGGTNKARSVPPRPVSRLKLERFRSFQEGELDLPPVTLVRGANGSGKTSICEALEIIWSGRTQRIPEDTKPAEFARHVTREGGDGFVVRYSFAGDGDDLLEATKIEENATAPLGRTVLAQHVLTQMASGSSRERLAAFLKATGLALPELNEGIASIRRDARKQVNRAFQEAGFTPIQAVNRDALGHLRKSLGASFSAELMPLDELEGAADSVYAVTDGSYQQERPMVTQQLRQALTEVDSAFARISADLDDAPDPAIEVDKALTALGAAAEQLRAAADPLRQLAQVIAPPSRGVGEGGAARKIAGPTSIAPETAASWLAHARGVERSASALEGLALDVDDETWRQRLDNYTRALRAAISCSSAKELEELVGRQREAAPRPSPVSAEVSSELLSVAGFARAPDPSPVVLAALNELHSKLSGYAAHLDEIASRIEQHPGRLFASRAARVMPAVLRFELTRELSNPRGALVRAQETLVNRLLGERLFPVVRELVACLARFEWYFPFPMRAHTEKNGLRFSGLATQDPTHDIRFLLNEAERAAVGIAWFLALHILQDPKDREVLALDDPANGFDEMNKAAFLATLRAVVRLLKPEQLVITTHDEAFATLLEQELVKVGDWPAEVGSWRCRRTSSKASKVDPWPLPGEESPQETDLSGELRTLGFKASRTRPRV